MKTNRHILLAMTFYHAPIHRGVARFAAENGWHLNAKMTITGKIPHGWVGDGAIIQGSTTEEYHQFITSLDIPKVCMGGGPMWSCPKVRDDNETIGKTAADYYMAKGFKNFAVYTEKPNSLQHELKAFINCIKQHNFTCTVISPGEDVTDWKAQSKQLADKIKQLPKPLAIFAHRDNAGAEMIDICLEHGIKVPTEVAILGKHNNTLVCEALAIPLSSVDNNLEQMGYMAAEILEKQLRSETVEPVALVPVKGVVTRASTDILAIGHEKVRRALLFIHQNYLSPISLAEIADASGMSVRGLQHAFHQQTGHTVNEEIIRLRLHDAKELLSRTDRTVETVALDSGFKSLRNFHNLFKKATNLTPKQYRQRNR